MRLYQYSHILFSDQILILLDVYLLCLFITLYWFIVYLGTYEGQRKQRAEVSFSLALCASQGSNSICQVRQRVPLPSKSSCLLLQLFYGVSHFLLPSFHIIFASCQLMSLSYFTLQQIISSDELSHCWTYYYLFGMYALERAQVFS